MGWAHYSNCMTSMDFKPLIGLLSGLPQSGEGRLMPPATSQFGGERVWLNWGVLCSPSLTHDRAESDVSPIFVKSWKTWLVILFR